jgi:alkylation response protein AidB-like acyl-CoA dehydrogenase
MVAVSTKADGLTMDRQFGQNYEHLFELSFDSVAVSAADVLGSVAQGREILDWTLARTLVAQCAIVSGVCDEAMRITAQYTCDRKQFDRQIGTFQAVSQRMADAYINNQAIELTMLQAATHLDEGREVPEEVLTAKWWACEGGNHVGHAALHVHGGISIDLDYPIHRYFLWIKQAEFTFGAATPQLVRLGKRLADTPA